MKLHKTRGGIISLGVRNTVSTFNDGEWGDLGTGSGGQCRVQVANRLNTDWFYDFIRSPIGKLAQREDHHIGWSVLYYLSIDDTVQPKIQPYILVGHCFDYTRVTDNLDRTNFAQRRSSAIQGGLGAHFKLSDRFDMSLVGQYMLHLGSDIHTKLVKNEVTFIKEDGVNLEGHILFNVSLNYKLADIW